MGRRAGKPPLPALFPPWGQVRPAVLREGGTGSGAGTAPPPPAPGPSSQPAAPSVADSGPAPPSGQPPSGDPQPGPHRAAGAPAPPPLPTVVAHVLIDRVCPRLTDPTPTAQVKGQTRKAQMTLFSEPTQGGARAPRTEGTVVSGLPATKTTALGVRPGRHAEARPPKENRLEGRGSHF